MAIWGGAQGPAPRHGRDRGEMVSMDKAGNLPEPDEDVLWLLLMLWRSCPCPLVR